MSDSVSFTILIDNDAHAPGMETEHGLSLWIETDTTRILFDTGASDAFLRNARTLGIDVSTLDHLALSHGHYDHTGGLGALDGILPESARIHAHPGVFAGRYSRYADGTVHPVGLPLPAERFLKEHKAQFLEVTGPVALAPGVGLTGPVQRETRFEDTGGDFWLDRDCTNADPIEDDLALWVERPEGLWIFLGCAHAGTVNTVRQIQSLSGRAQVHALVGGTHLRNASGERLEETVRFLRELSPAILFPCHCSGKRIRAALRSEGPEA